MAIDGQKRFRKRGGAKKKKNKQASLNPESPPTNSFTPPTPSYVSGFQPSTESALPSDLTSYLTSLSTTLSSLDPTGHISAAYVTNPTEDQPPPVLLATNALTELAPRALELARDNLASRLLETLLVAAGTPDAAAVLLLALLDGGPSAFASITAHRSGSHVVCAVVRAVAGRDEGKAADAVGKLAEMCAKWGVGELCEVMRSASGSHAVRDMVAVLAGIPPDEPRESKLDDSVRGRIVTYLESMRVDVVPEWTASVCAMGKTLIDGQAPLADLPWETAGCTSLQALLAGVAISDKALAQELAETAGGGAFGDMMYDACGSRFVERVVVCLGARVVEKEYKGRLAELGRDAKANFCVQRILLGLRGRGAVMGAWDELEEAVPGMIGFGKAREGVVLSLLRVSEAQGDENCRRRASRCVARACGAVGEKAKMLVGVLVMGSEEMWKKWQRGVAEMGRGGLGVGGREGDVLRVPRSVPMMSLLGALIARCIMRYSGGPGQAARDSMASLTDVEVLAMAGNPIGSRLIEQWMDGESKTVNSKVAGKVLASLSSGAGQKDVLAVAKNPYGAQILVRCVGWVTEQKRKEMMDAFAGGFEELKKHDCGQMVLRKCRVEQYMRRGDEWAHQESTRETRERLFADILEDEDGGDATNEKNSEENNLKWSKSNKGKKRKRAEAGDDPKVVPVSQASKEAEAIFETLTSSGGVEQQQEYSKAQKDKRASGGDVGRDVELSNVLAAIETAGDTPKEKKKKRKKEKKSNK